jgi:hypothetical protein
MTHSWLLILLLASSTALAATVPSPLSRATCIDRRFEEAGLELKPSCVLNRPAGDQLKTGLYFLLARRVFAMESPTEIFTPIAELSKDERCFRKLKEPKKVFCTEPGEEPVFPTQAPRSLDELQRFDDPLVAVPEEGNVIRCGEDRWCAEGSRDWSYLFKGAWFARWRMARDGTIEVVEKGIYSISGTTVELRTNEFKPLGKLTLNRRKALLSAGPLQYRFVSNEKSDKAKLVTRDGVKFSSWLEGS